jgi:uncharacterized protein YneF (UPF0154 family)
MNQKKGLQNRIRGWFPQHPYMISTGRNVENEVKNPPLMIPPRSKISLMKSILATAIGWGLVYGIGYLGILHQSTLGYVSVYQAILAVFIGLAFGVSSGTIVARRRTKRVLVDFQDSMSNDTALRIIFIVLLISLYAVGFFLFHRPMAEIFPFADGVMISLIFYMPCAFGTEAFWYWDFERKQDMRLVTGWFDGDVYLVPKSPRKDAPKT